MTIADWLVNSMMKLKSAGVPNGRTDCLVLLADLFEKDKSWVHAHPDHKIGELELRELNYKLKKRVNRIPLAYIRGFSEFYGRKFTVNSNVLIPRPESESFIELLKSLDFEAPRIADIGTGSGCIGVTAALELPESDVDLYDIDLKAMAVAGHNAAQHGLKTGIYQSDLLANLKSWPYDIFLTNLPYVPNRLITSPEIQKEPGVALFSGKDGLSHYSKFWKQVSGLDFKPKYIFTEALEEQHDKLEAMAKTFGYKLLKTDVLVQMFKF